MMELGSTVCSPKPNCSQCPITASCRVYNEARNMGRRPDSGAPADIEDVCSLCEPFEDAAAQDADLAASEESKVRGGTQSKAKQTTLSDFGLAAKSPAPRDAKREADAQEAISNYARRFPVKVVKKAVRAEEAVVCAIQGPDKTYLIHRRPERGLLAGLWEFPSKTVPHEDCSAAQRKEIATAHVGSLFGSRGKAEVEHVSEIGSVPWLFSHLKLTMYVHVFRVAGRVSPESTSVPARWTADVEGESMGTGMRKCWALVQACLG